MELKDLLLDAEKDLADYEDDVRLNVRNENVDYHDYLMSKVNAFKELQEFKKLSGAFGVI